MEVLEWQNMLLKLSRLQSEGAIKDNGTGSASQQVKMGILSFLNLKGDLIMSPIFGELIIKVASDRTKHSNISTSISPDYRQDWSNIRLLNGFGVIDKHGHEKSLMTAFKYDANENYDGIFIQVKNQDILLQSITDIVGKWDKKEVIRKLSKKSRLLLIGYRKDESGFHVCSVKVVYLDVDKLEFDFINLLKNGKITCESRMYVASDHSHCKSRGFVEGSLRNHGFGWRIKATLNSKLFKVIEVVEDRLL